MEAISSPPTWGDEVVPPQQTTELPEVPAVALCPENGDSNTESLPLADRARAFLGAMHGPEILEVFSEAELIAEYIKAVGYSPTLYELMATWQQWTGEPLIVTGANLGSLRRSSRQMRHNSE